MLLRGESARFSVFAQAQQQGGLASGRVVGAAVFSAEPPAAARKALVACAQLKVRAIALGAGQRWCCGCARVAARSLPSASR